MSYRQFFVVPRNDCRVRWKTDNGFFVLWVFRFCVCEPVVLYESLMHIEALCLRISTEIADKTYPLKKFPALRKSSRSNRPSIEMMHLVIWVRTKLLVVVIYELLDRWFSSVDCNCSNFRRFFHNCSNTRHKDTLALPRGGELSLFWLGPAVVLAQNRWEIWGGMGVGG